MHTKLLMKKWINALLCLFLSTAFSVKAISQLRPINTSLTTNIRSNLKLLASRLSTRTYSEEITITPSPSFPEDKKTPFTVVSMGDCQVIPVKYQSSTSEQQLFMPSQNIEDKFFPGAIFSAGQILDRSFREPSGLPQRNPMEITNTIFNPNANALATTELRNFSKADFDNLWKPMLRSNINGTTPGKIKVELIIAESTTQLKTDLKSTNETGVSAKLSVPLPDIPITVSPSGSVSASTSSSNSSSSELSQNTVILRWEQEFYSVSAIPKPGLGIFANNSDPRIDSMLYVHSISYGQIFYIKITSSRSKDELIKAVAKSTSTSLGGGVSVTGIPVSGEVNVTNTNSSMTQQQASSILSDASIQLFQYGGEPLFLQGTDLNGYLQQLQTKIKFSATNIGAPIKYTLNYVKGDAIAYFNYNLAYATPNCSGSQGRYKVSITATDMSMNGNWLDENVFGYLDCYVKYRPGGQLSNAFVPVILANNDTHKEFWTGPTKFITGGPAKNTYLFGNNGVEIFSARDYSLDELMSFQFGTSTNFGWKNGSSTHYYYCTECPSPSFSYVVDLTALREMYPNTSTPALHSINPNNSPPNVPPSRTFLANMPENSEVVYHLRIHNFKDNPNSGACLTTNLQIKIIKTKL